MNSITRLNTQKKTLQNLFASVLLYHTSNSANPVLSPTGDGSSASFTSEFFIEVLRSTLPNCSQSAVSYNGKKYNKVYIYKSHPSYTCS